MQLTEKQSETLKQNNIESNHITREAICGALYQLMEKNAYEEITMTDIIRRSGVSRSAVYRNFKTKEEIIREIISNLLKKQDLYQYPTLFENWRFGFDYFLSNKKSLDLIVKAHMEHILFDKVNESLRYQKDAPDLVSAMNYGLVMNVMIYWTKCGMPGTAEEAAMRIVSSYKEISEYVIPQISNF